MFEFLLNSNEIYTHDILNLADQIHQVIPDLQNLCFNIYFSVSNNYRRRRNRDCCFWVNNNKISLRQSIKELIINVYTNKH